MEAGEANSPAQLKALREELFDSLVVENRGRVVKTTGEGFLVEFVLGRRRGARPIAASFPWGIHVQEHLP